MYDPFVRLPAPILLMIIKLMPDFRSLDHFTQASPSVNGIFEELPVEITETLIDKLPADVAGLIRAYSVWLSKSWTYARVPVSSQTQMLEQVYKPFLAEPTQCLLLRNPTLSAIRDFLRVACRIHNLTTFFFETYIKRINATRPVHLVNPSHNFGKNPLVNNPRGRTYTPLQTGQASYVEELRVARALWYLQYHSTFTSYAADDMRKRVHHYTPWVTDETECVQEFLIENHISLNSRDPDQLVEKTSPHPTSSIDSSAPLHSSTLISPPTDPSSKAWRQDAEAAKEVSPANRFFHSYGKRAPTSPLKASAWRPFRRLGFDIWDLKRMCALELMDVPGEVPSSGGPYRVGVGMRMSPDHMGFTWKSIEGREQKPDQTAAVKPYVLPVPVIPRFDRKATTF